MPAHGLSIWKAIFSTRPFCVGRHRAAFRAFIREEADIVFANEAEICALYETEDFDAAAEAVRGEVAIAALTRSDKGSRIIAGRETHDIRAEPTKLLDSTGAGDAYAAGFMAALTRGLSLPECGRWGSIAAAEVISHFGARPQTDLSALIGAKTGGVAASLG